jgi:phosphoglycolate phosphatase-like HAD superfamily hydrolase
MHVCLFDIDGTLVTTGGAGRAAMEASLASEFGVLNLRKDIPYSGRTDRAIGRDLLAAHGVEPTEAAWRRLRDGYLRSLPLTLPQHPGRVLPGIAELLVQLSARSDVVVGLLTGNLRDGARLKLGHYQLFEHFRVGGYGDEHFDRDDVAREALAALHGHLNGTCDPARLWVIGDTPLDVRCARAIGARVLAVATGWHAAEELAAAAPDLLLPDLSDPEPLLRAIRDSAC